MNQDHILLTNQGMAWLDGFRAQDLEAARNLVRGLTLVSLSSFSRTIDGMVRETANTNENPAALFAVREVHGDRSYFSQATARRRRREKAGTVEPVGRTADIGSEGHVATQLRNIAKTAPSKYLNHPTVVTMRDQKCRTIIVVDDIVGSGRRTRGFLDAMWLDRTIRSWSSFGLIRFLVVAFAGTEGGIRYVKQAKCQPETLVYRDCPTYPNLPWPGSRRSEIIDLCKKYASQTSRPELALGFGGTMASLVFEHGCPNNAPAIIWAPAGKASNWEPLFPSRSVMPEQQSIFPLEIVRRDPISVLIDAGQLRLAETEFQRTGRVNSKQTLMIIALIAKGVRRNEALAFATGLSNASLETVVHKCIGWGLITPTRRITAAGRAELDHARRTRRLVPRVPVLRSDSYFPRMLRGTTGG